MHLAPQYLKEYNFFCDKRKEIVQIFTDRLFLWYIFMEDIKNIEIYTTDIYYLHLRMYIYIPKCCIISFFFMSCNNVYLEISSIGENLNFFFFLLLQKIILFRALWSKPRLYTTTFNLHEFLKCE